MMVTPANVSYIGQFLACFVRTNLKLYIHACSRVCVRVFVCVSNTDS